MDRPHVDYDSLAGTYNARYNEYRLDGIERALVELVRRFRSAKVLEVGCGTGRWIEPLRQIGASVVGADASMGMLSQARVPADLVQARGNALPFRAGSFDVIYTVNAIHHFDDARAFIKDAALLLKPGGMLATIGIDPRAVRRRYPYDYFEGAFELDMRRYPSFGQLVDWSSKAGLDDVELRIVDNSGLRYTGRAVLGDPFLKKDSNSLLALLSDAVYAAGLRNIEAAVARAEQRGETLEFRSDLAFGMVSGVKAR
jgi:ubiquinone/menaquinone biosynthesis C-methylase UbiE